MVAQGSRAAASRCALLSPVILLKAVRFSPGSIAPRSTSRPVERNYVLPGSTVRVCGEIDFEVLHNQLNSAACHFLGIVEYDREAHHVLYDLVTGPDWRERLASLDEVPSLPSALLDYMLGGQ